MTSVNFQLKDDNEFTMFKLLLNVHSRHYSSFMIQAYLSQLHEWELPLAYALLFMLNNPVKVFVKIVCDP